MQSDFLDAHHRHWEDANHLLAASHLANADHLYGLAAECGLKRLMIAFGMRVDSATGRPTDRADRVHASEIGGNDIWARYETYRSGHQAAVYYLGLTNPFVDWDVSQRYSHRSDFNPARVENHRQGAYTVHSLIKRAILEGIVP